MKFSELIRKREIIKLFYGKLATKLTKVNPDDDDGYLVLCYMYKDFLDLSVAKVVRENVNFKIESNVKINMKDSFKLNKHNSVPLSSYQRLKVTESILKELE
jgi:hypothetical protein